MRSLILASLLLTISWRLTDSADLACIVNECRLQQPNLKFLSVGDWGGLPFWPYTTYTQTHVAKGMSLMARTRGGVNFLVSTGDNFYFGGVSSVSDSRFRSTFDEVFPESSLPSPWYLIAGNHDHHGDVQAQIDYTRLSSRWTYPDYNYTVRYVLSDNTRVQLVMIDTVVLCGNTRLTAMNVLERSSAPKGASDPVKAEAQWEWIESTLREAKVADYLFVVGHYPILSVAEHGPTACLRNRLDPMLRKNRVSAYLAGHDHNLQHFEVIVGNWTGHYSVTGAGAYMDHSNEHMDDVPANSMKFFYPKSSWTEVFKNIGLGKGGFLYTEVNRQEGKFQYHNGDGKLLASFPLTPRFDRPRNS